MVPRSASKQASGINTVDTDGVALAAIQGLWEQFDPRDDRIDDLESANEALRELLALVEGHQGVADDPPELNLPGWLRPLYLLRDGWVSVSGYLSNGQRSQ